MSLVLNTNLASLSAQHSLSKSSQSLSNAMERLSSGLRINKAADDAAGMAISQRMTNQVNGMAQAVRNSNDAISLTSTAEGALQEITANLQRIRELAVQAANATITDDDRAALDLEVQQRLQEIDRSAQQTTFNGQKLLTGGFGNASFQVGANVGETISVNLSSSMLSTSIGKTADYVGGSTYDATKLQGGQGQAVGSAGTGVALAAGDLTIQVGSASAVTVGASQDYSTGTGNTGRGATSAYSKAQAINSANISGLTAVASTAVELAFSNVSASSYSLTINSTAIYSSYNATVSGNLTASAVASAVNAASSTTGVTASVDTSGNMTLSAADGRNISVTQTNAVGLGASAGDNATGNAGTTNFSGGTTYFGTIRLVAANNVTIAGATPSSAGLTATTLAVGTSALSTVSVSTQDKANTAITKVDAALSTVSAFRGTLGAVQNRFTSAITSTESAKENMMAARSRIQDADFAAESAAMTSANILQQAGVSVLSQANSAPQSILKLLQ